MDPTYALRTSTNTVEAWSTVRLPFEPKGRMLELRTELRAALRSLSPAPGAQLHAVYGATDDGQFVDTENVLLYNVGTAALSHLSESAVTVERVFAYPAPPDESALPPDRLHYQRYSVGAPTELHHWRPIGTLAAFDKVDVSSLTSPGPVWAGIRSRTPPQPRVVDDPARFLVRLKIRDRRPALRTNLATLIKPTLDGVISAFHSHTGQADHVAQRLADAGVARYDLVRRWLADPNWAALGPRTLVKPFGTHGVQWSPADDYLAAATVTIDRRPGAGPRWQLSGELAWAAPVS